MNFNCVPSEAFDIKSDSITLKEYPDDLLMYFSGTDTDLNLTVAEGLVSPFEPVEPDPIHVKVEGDATGHPYTFVDSGYELTYYKNNFRRFINGALRFTAKKLYSTNEYAYQDFYGFKGVTKPGQYFMRFNVWRHDSARIFISKKELYKIKSGVKGVYYLVPGVLNDYMQYTRYTCIRDFDDVVITDANVNNYYRIEEEYRMNSFTISVLLSDGDTWQEQEGVEQLQTIADLINNSIDNGGAYVGDPVNFPKPFRAEVVINDDDTYFLRFKTSLEEGTAVNYYFGLSEFSESNKASLMSWFNKVGKASYFSAPEVDTKIISFHEQNSTNNELSIIHKTDGNIYLYMTDAKTEFSLEKKLCAWEWNTEDFTEFELNFDDSLSNFIVNGVPKAFFETMGVNRYDDYDSIVRDPVQNVFMTLVGGGDGYGFKEIDVFNKKQHCRSYSVPLSVTDYDKNYYVEYVCGDTTVFDDATINIDCEGSFLFEVFDSGMPISFTDENDMGVCVSSTDPDDFIALFKKVDYDTESTLAFEADNLIFKITFLEKGSTLYKFEFDNGTEVYDENDPYNFEDIYEYVRRSLGAPQITCELTDAQIYDALCRAVEKYNKYRNWNENLNISDIGGNLETDLKKVVTKAEGTYFLLPANISDKDIIDIYFQPRFSVCWFGAGDSFLNNVMAQTFFGLYGGIVQNSADYYIHRVSTNDISNIIGTQVSWKIYNHHLYLTPNNLSDLEQFTVGIVYRPTLTVEEIRNNQEIKNLTLAYAMRTLGLIRGSFGGSIQAGDIAIQLNAETLLSEADKLEDKTIALLKSEQKPLWIIWS